MTRAVLVVAVVMGLSSPVVAADRLTDRDVKGLITRIEQGRDKFDDELDGKLKNSVVRQASGEVNVKDVLNDFQESIDRVEERLKPEYAASAEVGTLLRRGSAIETFFRQQPPGTKGESENQLTNDAKALRDRVKDTKPSSAEASKLLAQASKVQKFVDSHQVPASAAAWKAVAGQVQMVANAYGAPWPR